MGCRQSLLSTPSSQLTIINYEFKSILGQGGFALVKEMRRVSDDNYCAIKEIDIIKMLKNGKDVDILLTELKIMIRVSRGCEFGDLGPEQYFQKGSSQRILKQSTSSTESKSKQINGGFHGEKEKYRKNNYIVKLYCAFYENEKCYFVMEPLYGSDLRYYLKHSEIDFNEENVAYFIACIGSALCHIHIQNVMHRDVKPENISLDRYGRPYLTDFGISCFEQKSQLIVSTSTSGTLPYLSPETLTASHRHSYHSDFWSLGITAYELLYKFRPYKSHCPKDLISFVDHHYSHIWKGIRTISLRNYEMIQYYSRPLALPTTSINSPSYVNSHDEEYGQANESLKGAEIQALPPSQSSSLPPIPSDSIKSTELPSPFCLSFPLLSNGREISCECEDLISSLLDPRIHMRYGAGMTASFFLHHEWFQQYVLSSEDLLLRYKPSFLPNVKRVTHHLQIKFENLTHQIKQEQQLKQQMQHHSSISSFRLSRSSAVSPRLSASYNSNFNGSFCERENGKAISGNKIGSGDGGGTLLTKEIIEKLKFFYYNPEDEDIIEKDQDPEKIRSSYRLVNSTLVIPFESKSASLLVNSTRVPDNDEAQNPPKKQTAVMDALIITDL